MGGPRSSEQAVHDSESRDPTRMLRSATPGIYHRGNRFVVVWRHRGRQHKQSCLTYSDALALKARRLSGDTRPEWRPSGRDSFRHYARCWVDEYRGRTHRGLDESTRADYRISLEAWAIPSIGGLRIADVVPRDIRMLMLTMEREGLRPSTIRKHIAPLKALFATAYEDGVVSRNPMLTIRVAERRPDLQSQPPRRKALTHAELERVLEVLSPADRLLVEFAVHTGVRCSELAGLSWEHIAFGARTSVSVRQQYRGGRLKPPKTAHSVRTLPLSAGMATSLLELRTARNAAPFDPVFPTPTGQRLDGHNFATRVLRPAARQAGIDRLGFHRLRHTCAGLLFESGKDLKQVQEWLGHSHPRTTMETYLHLLDRGLGNAEFMDLYTGRALFPR